MKLELVPVVREAGRVRVSSPLGFGVEVTLLGSGFTADDRTLGLHSRQRVGFTVRVTSGRRGGGGGGLGLRIGLWFTARRLVYSTLQAQHINIHISLCH